MHIFFFTSLHCSGQETLLAPLSRYGKGGRLKQLLFDDTPEHKSEFSQIGEDGRIWSTEFHACNEKISWSKWRLYSSKRQDSPNLQIWPTIEHEIKLIITIERGWCCCSDKALRLHPWWSDPRIANLYCNRKKSTKEEELKADFGKKLHACFMAICPDGSQEAAENMQNASVQSRPILIALYHWLVTPAGDKLM